LPTPYQSTPSPKVTGSVCLVPSREFSRAPLDLLLAHLCRFPVRSPRQLARGFSWKPGLGPFVARRPPHHVSGSPLQRSSGFPCQSPLRAWTRSSIRGRCLAFSVPPSLISSPRRNRTINLLPLVYASRPPLRCRLTLGGLTFPRNPWASGEQVFHLLSRYSCRHSRFRLVQPSSRSAFPLPRNAPLPPRRSPSWARSVGGALEPR
jgi:hypothetical protein